VYVFVPRSLPHALCLKPSEAVASTVITEGGFDTSTASNERLRTAVATLAAKARDHAALLVDDHRIGAPDAAGVLGAAAAAAAAAAAVPRLRHLSWECWHADSSGGAAAAPGDWARLAASLESLELTGPLAALGYAEPLAALTGLTQLFLSALPETEAWAAQPLPLAGGARAGGEPPTSPASSAPARTARALARLPRLAHLRVSFPEGTPPGKPSEWGCPAVAAEVAAELARCPALRLLEIDRRGGPLWRHELGPLFGPGPVIPRPSPAWPPFAQALSAGGFCGTVRPAPQGPSPGFGVEI
jgi:hypothetical protein